MPDRLTRPDSVILGTAAALLAASLVCGLMVPPLFGLLLMASVVVAVVFLALCFPTGFCIAWLLITSMTLEMTLRDLVGENAFQPTIAVVKGIPVLILLAGDLGDIRLFNVAVRSADHAARAPRPGRSGVH
jgi:hypothetical protein